MYRHNHSDNGPCHRPIYLLEAVIRSLAQKRASHHTQKIKCQKQIFRFMTCRDIYTPRRSSPPLTLMARRHYPVASTTERVSPPNVSFVTKFITWWKNRTCHSSLSDETVTSRCTVNVRASDQQTRSLWCNVCAANDKLEIGKLEQRSLRVNGEPQQQLNATTKPDIRTFVSLDTRPSQTWPPSRWPKMPHAPHAHRMVYVLVPRDNLFKLLRPNAWQTVMSGCSSRWSVFTCVYPHAIFNSSYILTYRRWRRQSRIHVDNLGIEVSI